MTAALALLVIVVVVASGQSLATPVPGQSDFGPRSSIGAAAAGAFLHPGATGDASLAVSNPGPDPMTVTGVSLRGSNGDIAADAAHPACTTTGVSFTGRGGLSVRVPAKHGDVDGMTEVLLADAVSMSNASGNGCQGARFSIPVTITERGMRPAVSRPIPEPHSASPHQRARPG